LVDQQHNALGHTLAGTHLMRLKKRLSAGIRENNQISMIQ
jgi:hypothetical protein